ncbi:MAG TPA: sugar phosphate nucleotidyltransferase [Chitinophagaceae bacterium]|nr:sugar phosphate nucleotidyltransferase [Chitinophagaceae bacterium]
MDNNKSKLTNSPLEVGGAMIFSAGLGTRFKPWTDMHPKALALINGKSLLQRNVEYLHQYGIKDIVVNVHHFADQVIDAIQKNNGWGSNIIVSDERDEVLETGGGLLKAKDLFKPGEKFITCNVDILTDLDINKLIAFHELRRPLISLAVTNRKTSRYLLFDKNDRLAGWKNKKTGEERGPVLTVSKEEGKAIVEKAYSAVAVFEPEIFSHISFTGKFSLIDVYLELAKNHLVSGYDHSGDKFVDVGKPENIALAESLFP